MTKPWIFLILFFSVFDAYSQRTKLTYINAALTTSHTAFPFARFSKLFTKEFHPGFELGTGFDWRTSTKHDWFQSFNVGYTYHRYVQHGIALYSEFGYRYKLPGSFDVEAKAGLGYLHVVSTGKIFKLGDKGFYKKETNLGRPQAMATLSLRINKGFTKSGLAVFVQYQQRLQFPFIKSYVPLLPSNILMAGVKLPWRLKKVSQQ